VDLRQRLDRHREAAPAAVAIKIGLIRACICCHGVPPAEALALTATVKHGLVAIDKVAGRVRAVRPEILIVSRATRCAICHNLRQVCAMHSY
jgi:hypothetical protein